MICYRTVDDSNTSFSDIQEILEASGSSRFGGRWNHIGQKAVYLSYEKEVTFAEKGFYSIIALADQLEISTKSPKENKKKIIDRSFSLLTLELELEQASIVDLTVQGNLSKYLQEFNLGNYTVEDSRLSPYMRLPSKWTQELGTSLAKSGVIGITVKSARSDISNNLIIFPENLATTKVRVQDKNDVLLSALDKSDNKYSLVSALSPKSRILAEMGGSQMRIDVLNSPAP
ncbi:hypothetical protein DOM21_17385 [Bacteriovorax stolpii]|uniref:RES domain-containing protein n=1 Tax=Bacteriovorax stolpii TaxID=960 RepID=UPI00115C2E5D|nr:RES domain-containing protein [Bacteriovorax stolpii]QDK43196.1 hypothetical protein DOM21_17385 [Bacteriovorax stolpii]